MSDKSHSNSGSGVIFSHALRGIMLVLAAVLVFASMDTMGKFLLWLRAFSLAFA